MDIQVSFHSMDNSFSHRSCQVTDSDALYKVISSDLSRLVLGCSDHSVCLQFVYGKTYSDIQRYNLFTQNCQVHFVRSSLRTKTSIFKKSFPDIII